MSMTLEQVKAKRIADSRIEAEKKILKLYPAWLQRSVALGLYDDKQPGDKKHPEAVKSGIRVVIDEQNAMEKQIESMKDINEIDHLRFP